MESPNMADWLESFVPIEQHVMVRFGKWEEILEQELPEDRELYCVTTATMRYARAVALATLGRTDEAVAEAAEFDRAYERVPESRYQFNNPSRDILAIAQEMMRGRLRIGRGRSTTRSLTCGGRWSWTTTCTTTSRGAGCSRSVMLWGLCCWSRVGLRRRLRSTGRTLGMTHP